MTCVSLKCPFIKHCKDYNFLIERGTECSIQKEIIEKSKQIIKERKL